MSAGAEAARETQQGRKLSGNRRGGEKINRTAEQSNGEMWSASLRKLLVAGCRLKIRRNFLSAAVNAYFKFKARSVSHCRGGGANIVAAVNRFILLAGKEGLWSAGREPSQLTPPPSPTTPIPTLPSISKSLWLRFTAMSSQQAQERRFSFSIQTQEW